MSFLAANGSVLFLVWIFKGATTQEHQQMKLTNEIQSIQTAFIMENPLKCMLQGQNPTMYAFTKLRYSNTTIHKDIMSSFCKIWNIANEHSYCWLFGDQLASHKNADMVIDTLKSHVMCWLFPANCSHFLQPLNAAAFA